MAREIHARSAPVTGIIVHLGAAERAIALTQLTLDALQQSTERSRMCLPSVPTATRLFVHPTRFQGPMHKS